MSNETDTFPGKTKAWMQAFSSALGGRMTPCGDGPDHEYEPKEAVDHAFAAATYAEARAVKEHEAAQAKALADRKAAIAAIRVGAWYSVGGTGNPWQVVHVCRIGNTSGRAWFSDGQSAGFEDIVWDMEPAEAPPDAKPPTLADAVRAVLRVGPTEGLRVDLDHENARVLDVYHGPNERGVSKDDWDRMAEVGVPVADAKPLWRRLEEAAAKVVSDSAYWLRKGVPYRYNQLESDGGVSFIGPQGWCRWERPTEFLRDAKPITSEEFAKATGKPAAA